MRVVIMKEYSFAHYSWLIGKLSYGKILLWRIFLKAIESIYLKCSDLLLGRVQLTALCICRLATCWCSLVFSPILLKHWKGPFKFINWHFVLFRNLTSIWLLWVRGYYPMDMLDQIFGLVLKVYCHLEILITLLLNIQPNGHIEVLLLSITGTKAPVWGVSLPVSSYPLPSASEQTCMCNSPQCFSL